MVRGSSDPLYDPEVKRANVPEQKKPRRQKARPSRSPVALARSSRPVNPRRESATTDHTPRARAGVAHRRRGMPADRPLSADERYMLARIVLNDLIDRTVVIQEANRVLKDKKQKQMFMDIANKVWDDEELPRSCGKRRPRTSTS